MTAVVDWLLYAVPCWLVALSLYGMATSRNLIHLVICLGVFHAGVLVLLLAVGFHRDATGPVFDDIPLGHAVTDPVMQAIAITDVVVGDAVLAVLLALSGKIYTRFGTLDPGQLKAIRG
jgi:multicomponent Na+:H+ antiporter subunit C